MDAVITKPEWQYHPSHSPGRSEFTCTGTCRMHGRLVDASGRGRSKAEARMAAAQVLVERVRNMPPPTGEPPGLVPPPRRAPGEQHGSHAASWPRPATGPHTTPDAGDTVSLPTASDVAVEALATGCALTVDSDRDGVRFLIYRPDGRPMPHLPLPDPMHPAIRDLALGHAAGARRASVTCWVLPLSAAVPALVPTLPAGAHPSARAWAAAARLGLELIAARALYPTLDDDDRDTWCLATHNGPARQTLRDITDAMPPHAHCRAVPNSPNDPLHIDTADEAVDAFLRALADHMLRPPGAPVLFGAGPFTNPGPGDAQHLRPWTDAVEDTLDPAPPPGLHLHVQPPDGTDAATGTLRATLLLQLEHRDHPVPAHDVWSGHHHPDARHLRARTRRALRRIADGWGPAERLAAQPAPAVVRLTASEAVRLAEAPPANLTISWPADMIGALTARTVVGIRSGSGPTRLGLAELLDFRWELALHGRTLTDAEMDSLAEAARPLVRLRGTWILVDDASTQRAAHPHLAPLEPVDALGAALTGSVTIDGHMYPCAPADGLAELVATLRAATSDAHPVPLPDTLAAELRTYQHRGLTWLARVTGLGYGACLADDMGLGKTVTTIALALHRRATGISTGPTLVVARTSVVTNWIREIRRFAPATPVIAYHGPGRTLADLTPDTIVVTTYGIVQRDTALTDISWDLILADEAQSIKNPSSAAARRLREVRARARVAITGTPIENRTDELWALMDWTNPGLLGTRTTFRARYGRHAERDTTGDAARRLGLLVGPFLLRRLKTDPGIAPELPDKLHERHIVRLTREQGALYEAAVRETMAAITESAGIARHGLVVRLLTALRQICNHPAHYLKEPGPDTPGATQHFAARSAKLAALDDVLDQITACGESTLIFTSYVAMGRLLDAHLRARGLAPNLLHGGTPPTARQRMIDDFQAGGTRVLILSVKAAGAGLNLTQATHVVHYDQQWNPAVEDQATDRAHRIGQRRAVTVHHLVAEATLEDRIADLLHHKRALADAILATDNRTVTDLTDQELVELVTLGTP
ncbi:SNF2-related protein (plasmid) [Embleya sp. NBC_00888]|uniref:SNF2-related protein n=1 Tax=Embleya sp. NBC_00888 TaxID=2975960 RepID=UPI00386B9A56|nr:SNF2-related protein [Embleya sp. NBC_00888]